MRLVSIAVAAALTILPGAALAMSHRPPSTPGHPGTVGGDTPAPPETPEAPPSGGGDAPVSVPEPATLALLGSGIAALGVARRRRRKS